MTMLLTTPQDYGAAGNGTTNDTTAWNNFQAATGIAKFVPPGRYLVNGVVKRFDKGAFGNGNFDDDGSFEWVHGDRQRDSLIVHSRTINAYDALNPGAATNLSPAIKTQTKVSYTSNATGSDNSLFVWIADTYHEAIGSGTVVNGVDGDVGNFTTLGAVSDNRFAGLFGMTAITGRVFDATESEVPGILIHGASKSLAGYFPFTRRSRYASGGYMMGTEVYCFWDADESVDIPYTNNDAHAFTSFTVGAHYTAFGSSAPITDAILIDSPSGAKHGFYNGLVIGGSALKINNVSAGALGTVGINLSSWSSTSHGDIGIKFRVANRHLHFREGAKIQSPVTRFVNSAGPADVRVEALTGNTPIIRLGAGDTTVATPATTEYGALLAVSDIVTLRATVAGGEVHLSPDGGSTSYRANSARFGPVGTDGVKALGAAANRWATVYAATGTINTSDARDKVDIRDVSERERAVAVRLKGVIKAFRFKDAVEKKGQDARIHFGVIAQEVSAAFMTEGLDPHRYSLFCYDEWEAVEDAVHVEKVEIAPPVYQQIEVRAAYVEKREVVAAKYDENGKEVSPAEYQRIEHAAVYDDGEIIVPTKYEEIRTVTPGHPAGARYGIRYDELFAFIISAL